VYSLGCVLFHLLAGRPPFVEKNVMAQMVKHATEKPAPLASMAEKVPPGLQAVFDKITAKRPDDRFQTPAAAAEALRPFLPSEGVTATAPAVLPAYKQWLESESGMDLPAELKKPSAAPTPPPKPAALVAKPTGAVPAAKPVAARPVPPAEDVIDVELVSPPASAADHRSLLDLNRRDFLMLGTGGVLVGLAIGVGVGLAKLLAGPTNRPEPTDGKEPDKATP
jgi:serine/threonine protein kinase